MNENKPPIWFWIVSIVALLWNLMGIANYLMQAYMTDEMKAALPQEQQEQLANLPSWYIAAFAIAVFAGALGCIALLMRRKWASIVLIVSLIGVVLQMSYITFVLKMSNFMTSIIVITAIALVIFAKKSKELGWLR